MKKLIRPPRPPLMIADFMRWPALAVEPDCPADRAFELMRENEVRHLIVTLGNAPIGCVCMLDAAEAMHAPVDEIATVPQLLSPWESATRAVSLLRETNSCAVIVPIPGRECGILTRGDLARAEICSAWPRCQGCGTTHRVRANLGAELAFCAECLEGGHPIDDAELDEIPWGLDIAEDREEVLYG